MSKEVHPLEKLKDLREVQLHEKDEMEKRLKRLFPSIPSGEDLEEEFLPHALALAGETMLADKLSSGIIFFINEYARKHKLEGVDRSYILNSATDIIHNMTVEKTRDPDPAYSAER